MQHTTASKVVAERRRMERIKEITDREKERDRDRRAPGVGDL